MNRIYYFAQLVAPLGRSEEQVELPAHVTDVASLLAWLRLRGGHWDSLCRQEQMTVTINKQFAEATSPIKPGDELALVGRAR